MGSSSWRIPLGIQILPGILLGIGCVFLPPSPRLLVYQGKTSEALHSLARLRFPRASKINERDPLLQLEFLEMRADAASVIPPPGNNAARAEAVSWARLFEPKYIRRTLVGVFVMFWQRENRKPHHPTILP